MASSRVGSLPPCAASTSARSSTPTPTADPRHPRRRLAKGGLQAELVVGSADDHREREADEIATFAARANDAPIAQLLLDRGALANVRDANGLYPIALATRTEMSGRTRVPS